MKKLCIAFASLALAAGARGDDWRGFRGTDATATSATAAPIEWSESKNLVWKTALPGPGSSSPIVVGDAIFVTCWSGYALDRDDLGDIAKALWARETSSLDQCYGTPTRVDHDGASAMVVALLDEICALDPLTGESEWTVTTRDDGALAPTVVAGDDMIDSLGGQTGDRTHAGRGAPAARSTSPAAATACT